MWARMTPPQRHSMPRLSFGMFALMYSGVRLLCAFRGAVCVCVGGRFYPMLFYQLPLTVIAAANLCIVGNADRRLALACHRGAACCLAMAAALRSGSGGGGRGGTGGDGRQRPARSRKLSLLGFILRGGAAQLPPSDGGGGDGSGDCSGDGGGCGDGVGIGGAGVTAGAGSAGCGDGVGIGGAGVNAGAESAGCGDGAGIGGAGARAGAGSAGGGDCAASRSGWAQCSDVTPTLPACGDASVLRGREAFDLDQDTAVGSQQHAGRQPMPRFSISWGQQSGRRSEAAGAELGPRMSLADVSLRVSLARSSVAENAL